MKNRNATVAVVGAGDFIGAAIAKKFASEGFTVFAGRRKGVELGPLVAEIEAAGGRVVGRSLDARKEEEITAFLQDADVAAPLEVCVFNIGANVNFPLLETTERVFRQVWEMACYAGFLTGREAARLMLPRGHGNIFFTGATAGMRGGTLLTYAQSTEMVDLLIAHGVNPSKANKNGECPLLSFVWGSPAMKEAKAISMEFIAKGANVNCANRGGFTALHFVRDPELAKLLIDRHADVNAGDNGGFTPFIKLLARPASI